MRKVTLLEDNENRSDQRSQPFAANDAAI